MTPPESVPRVRVRVRAGVRVTSGVGAAGAAAELEEHTRALLPKV